MQGEHRSPGWASQMGRRFTLLLAVLAWVPAARAQEAEPAPTIFEARTINNTNAADPPADPGNPPAGVPDEPSPSMLARRFYAPLYSRWPVFNEKLGTSFPAYAPGPLSLTNSRLSEWVNHTIRSVGRDAEDYLAS